MSRYRIGTQCLGSEDPAFQDCLASAYAARLRPLCLCREPSAAMYIARLTGRYVIKRMPDSGGEHAPGCDSYEPPPELSGLGQLLGSAIREDAELGRTALRLEFSLTRVAGRQAPVASGAQAPSVRCDGTRLSLRATLHYLWEEAGFHRWTPAMAGKRSWYVVRKYLLQAAGDKTTHGLSLADLLYIPEAFQPEHRQAIAQRRVTQLLRAATPVDGRRQLMLLIAEVRAVEASRYGHKILFRQVPDFPFMLDEALHRRMQLRFAVELGLWDALPDTHLLAIATFGLGRTGVAAIEELSLMVVTAQWIPFESTFEKQLIEAMVDSGRRFSKGLRYNLPATRPLACMVASDTHPGPTAMYLLAPGVEPDYVNTLNGLVQDSQLAHWIWDAGEAEMPALPVPVRTGPIFPGATQG